ncbi:MAG: carbonic anhydrase [Terriglobia bacterium]
MSIRSLLSRRAFFSDTRSVMGGLALSGAWLAPVGNAPAPARINGTRPSAGEALRRLLEGNERFAGDAALHPGRRPEDFLRLAGGQTPIAVILACADSRVPPEIVFDQGIGDLFVVRVAGNYVTGAGASVKGSIEYGVAELGAPLIMVLGHSQCGAVKAAMKSTDTHTVLPGSINDLVSSIKPAVLAVGGKPGNPLENAIQANVQGGVEALKMLQPILAPRVAKGELKVVGAMYELSSGKVTLLG